MEKHRGLDKSKKSRQSRKSRNFKRSYHPRLFHLTANHLRNMLRDKIQVIFLIGFPLAFMILLGLQTESLDRMSYDVLIINDDIIGFEEDPENILYIYNTSASLQFMGILESEELQGAVKIAGYNTHSIAEAKVLLRKEKCHALIVIGENFSEAMYREKTGCQDKIELNITTINDDIVKMVIETIATQIVESMSLQLNGVDYANVTTQNSVDYVELSIFDIFVPGILVAGVLVCISQVAAHFAGEKERGTMIRLATTAVSRREILLSGALSQFIVTTFQIILMLLIALMLGAYIHPNANWFLLIFILTLLIFSVIGMGLTIASFLKDSMSASLYSWFLIIPLQVLGGIFTYGAEFEYSFIFPTYWAVHALRVIMLNGIGTWEAIGVDIIYLTVFGLATTLIGVLLFQRKKAILS